MISASFPGSIHATAVPAPSAPALPIMTLSILIKMGPAELLRANRMEGREALGVSFMIFDGFLTSTSTSAAYLLSDSISKRPATTLASVIASFLISVPVIDSLGSSTVSVTFSFATSTSFVSCLRKADQRVREFFYFGGTFVDVVRLGGPRDFNSGVSPAISAHCPTYHHSQPKCRAVPKSEGGGLSVSLSVIATSLRSVAGFCPGPLVASRQATKGLLRSPLTGGNPSQAIERPGWNRQTLASAFRPGRWKRDGLVRSYL